MICVKYEGNDGFEMLVPMSDHNIYLSCERCGNTFYVEKPWNYISEIGKTGTSLDDSFEFCEKCKKDIEWLLKVFKT